MNLAYETQLNLTGGNSCQCGPYTKTYPSYLPIIKSYI